MLVAALLAVGCEAPPAELASPSDDPDHYQVDTSRSYVPRLSAPRWVVPSAALPAVDGVKPMAANNNVDIVLHGGRLFMAWRSAETHFASPNTKMFIVSSADMGRAWQHEQTIALGADLREPRFLSTGSRLLFHLFEGGTTPLSFEPRKMWRSEYRGPGDWTPVKPFGQPMEVPWTIKWRRGAGWITSYLGTHYDLDKPGKIDLLFRTSSDGLSWKPVDPARPAVYRGGVSEAAFEFDEQGGLWAITRNEDGDSSGFGSHLCHAPAADLARWDCPKKSDPERYDSPWMLRHGKELYLVARRDLGGPFDQGQTSLPFAQQKKTYLSAYSTRPKRTALYRIDRQRRKVVHLLDLPSAGDTAFPSVRRTGAHSFIIANYTSPLDKPNISWLAAQASPRGTQIYLMDLTFEAQ